MFCVSATPLSASFNCVAAAKESAKNFCKLSLPVKAAIPKPIFVIPSNTFIATLATAFSPSTTKLKSAFFIKLF